MKKIIILFFLIMLVIMNFFSSTSLYAEEQGETIVSTEEEIQGVVQPSSILKSFDLIKIYDGTEPFDLNDEAGNDSGSENLIIRSFDKIVYRTSYSTVSYDELETISNGIFRFKAELPVSPSIATFDIKSMEWLNNINVITSDSSTIIEGDITIENDVVSPRVGTLNWTVEVKDAKNGQIIESPIFYMAVNDGEYISTKGDNITVSAKANVNARIVHEGFIKDKPLFSVVLELLANNIGKGIKGQEIVNINHNIEFDLVSNTSEPILAFKINNNEGSEWFDEGISGKNIPVSGSFETLFNQVFNSGSINIENNHVTISNFSFDDLRNKVTNNANKNNNLAGFDYDDDHYPFGAYVFISEKPLVLDNNQIYSFKIENLTYKSIDEDILNEINLNDNEATYLLSKPEGGGPGIAGGPAQFLDINVINPTTKESFSYINGDSSRNIPPDYEVYPGELVRLSQGAMLYKSNYRPYIKKYNGLVKFDTKIFEALMDNEEYSSPIPKLKSTGFYWVAKEDKTGWNNEEEMYNAHIDDVKNKNGYILFTSASKAINEGYTIVAFLSECEFENPNYVITWDGFGTYPALRVKKDALLNEDKTVMFNNDDPKRVGVILAELQGIDYDDNIYNRINIFNSLGDDIDMYGDSKDIKIGFIKSTYDNNGILKTTSQSNAIGNRNGNWTHAASLVGGSFFVKSYNTYINEHISQRNNNMEKEVYNLHKNQYNVYFHFDSGTSLNHPTNITDDFIITQEIPSTLQPVNNSDNIEEKWNIVYDGEIIDNQSVDGISIENYAKNFIESKTVKELNIENISYEVFEEKTDNTTKIIWKINNYPVSYKLPTIHFTAKIDKELDNGTNILVNGEITSKNVIKRNIDSVGIKAIRIGGASIEKIAIPQIRNNNPIRFKISFKNDAIFSKNSENIDVLTLDILPFDDGKTNIGLNLGDYFLDKIKMSGVIYDDNESDNINPSFRIYYSTNIFESSEIVLLDKNQLIDLESMNYKFIDLELVKTGNNYVFNNAATKIQREFGNQKITAIGFLSKNIGNRSKYDFEYEYNWIDDKEKFSHEKNDFVYNRVDMAIASNINQTTYDKAYSSPVISKEIISINDKQSDIINGLNGVAVQDSDVVEYKINYSNPYLEECNIKIIDNIPEGTEIIKETISDGGYIVDNHVEWNFAKVSSEYSGYVTFKVRVIVNDIIKKIVNKAKIQYNNNPYIESNIITNPKQNIVAEKYSNPVSGSTVKKNEEIEYFIKVKNTSDFEIENVVISDKIPNLTTFKEVKNDGIYNISTNTVSYSIPKLYSGEEKIVSFIVTVNDYEKNEVIENSATYGIGYLNKETNKVIHKTVVDAKEKPKEKIIYSPVNTGVKSKIIIYGIAIVISIAGMYILKDNH